MKTTTARRTRLGVERLDGREVPAFLGPITSAGGGVALAVGDFNHDGRDDVAAVGGTATPSTGLQVVSINGTARVSLSNGDGSLRPPITLTGAKGYDLVEFEAVGMNGDGNLDGRAYTFGQDFNQVKTPKLHKGDGCLVCEPPTYTTAYDNVWLGNGDGTFARVRISSRGVGVPWWWDVGRRRAFADFNLDGIADKATVDGTTAVVSVALAKPDGSYRPAQSYPAGPTPDAIIAGDFNGDGRIDLVVANSSTSGDSTLSELINDGNW